MEGTEMYTFLLLFVFIILCTFPLLASLPGKIEELIHLKKYEKAINLLENLATQGNNEAQNKLGELYHFSHSRIVDYSKAREWYLKSVSGGNGVAANHLGRIYMNGEGVKQDKKVAVYWYKKGKELGNKDAEYNYYLASSNLQS